MKKYNGRRTKLVTIFKEFISRNFGSIGLLNISPVELDYLIGKILEICDGEETK